MEDSEEYPAVQAVEYQIKNETLRKWFNKNDERYWNFIRIYREFIDKDYIFDPSSGFFFRQTFPKKTHQEALGHTSLDIVFTRQSDLHYHEDVDEIFKVLSGHGKLYNKGTHTYLDYPLKAGKTYIIDKDSIHAFAPKSCDHLEIHLECSGVLDPAREIQVKRFDKWSHKRLMKQKF